MFKILFFFLWSLFISSKSVVNASAEYQAKQLLLHKAVIEGIKKQCNNELANFMPIKSNLKKRGKMVKDAGVKDLSLFSLDDTEVDTYISWACAGGANGRIHKDLPSYAKIGNDLKTMRASNDNTSDEFDVIDESQPGATEEFTTEEASFGNQGYSGLAISFFLGLLLGAVVHYFHTSSTTHNKMNLKVIRRPEL